MLITRRRFLTLSGAFAGAALLAGPIRAQERFIAAQGPWRKFDIVAKVSFKKPKGKAQAWIPVPSVNENDWSKALGSDWQTNASAAQLIQGEAEGADMVYLEWAEETADAIVEISSHAETRDRLTDFTKPEAATPLSDEERTRFTAPVSLVPHTDWLREQAAKITENAKTDLGKAKSIYEWVVQERSCDTADMKMLLATPGPASTPGDTVTRQDCDFLNSLFVGLARVSGLPAREIYGVRVAPSQFGYESLGALPEDITAETSSRAEIWLGDYGWVPASPADVRRVIQGEAPGNLALTDPKAVSARVTLFGAWEGNWIAYNMANDITLPKSQDVKLPDFLRPYVITQEGAMAEGGPEGFSYKLTATELPA